MTPAKRSLTTYCVVASLLLTSLGVSAQVLKSGNDLLKACSVTLKVVSGEPPPADFSGAQFCMAYLEGFRSGIEFSEAVVRGQGASNVKLPICIPSEATNGQILRVVTKFLIENPERLHEDKLTLTATALNRAFPCK